jgi:hypothetical protein
MGNSAKAMRKYVMHLTQQTYEEIGDGRVRVTTRSGKSGVFRWDGEWLEGDACDPNANMLVYTAGPDMPEGFGYRWTQVPVDTERLSGWPEHLERQLISAGIIVSTRPR